MIQPLLTTCHPFIYVHIGFWILKNIINTKLWNNYYNTNDITDVPTTLLLSQMKRVPDYPYFLHPLPNSISLHVPVATLSLFECKLVGSVHWCIDIGKLYSLIAQKFEIRLLIKVRRNVRLLEDQIFSSKYKYLLVQQHQCRSQTIPNVTNT